MQKLIEILKSYSQDKITPMHMPGHKRITNQDYLKDLNAEYDITEIHGFDNLHNANGILQSSMKEAALLWGARHSFFLINGSTCGILAGIYAATKPHDKILVMRNSHKSVYNAIQLNMLNPIFIQPDHNDTGIFYSLDLKSVQEQLNNNPDIKLIVITSPTYEGVISDIKSICKIAHQSKIPVLVDQAHGAHLDFSDYFSGGAIKAGADIVVQSLHKTLPSLTQTAILHLNGNLINKTAISNTLSIFQTSSPSYLLLASIDGCVDFIKNKGNNYFKQWEKNLKLFSEQIKPLKKLSVLMDKEETPFIYKFDYSKIVIETSKSSITGTKLMEVLREKYKIELEMASQQYALALTGIFDELSTLSKLAAALIEIDSNLTYDEQQPLEIPSIPKRYCSITSALSSPSVGIDANKSVGKVSAEYLWAYPPGIPLITPGEIISEQLIKLINGYTLDDINLQSSSNGVPKTIKILAEVKA